MWLKRSLWEDLVRKSAIVEVLKEQITAFNGLLKLAAEEEQRLETLVSELRARVAELEDAVVKQSDELNVARRVQASPTKPISLDTLFAEDPELVEKDREHIKKHGTSDPLLVSEYD